MQALDSCRTGFDITGLIVFIRAFMSGAMRVRTLN